MPINRYSVLKGDPISGALNTSARPHYILEVNAGSTRWQVAFNIESDTGLGAGAQVLYKIDSNWTPPDAAMLEALPVGVTPLAGKDANPAIDYLRSRADGQPLINRDQTTALPLPAHGVSGNLANAVIQFLNQAVADPQGTVYAFGAQYTTGNGIHDIHLNQGNPAGHHAGDNGIWQDGLLVFNMPANNQWAAIFIAFQEQVWNTDDGGNPI